MYRFALRDFLQPCFAAIVAELFETTAETRDNRRLTTNFIS